MCFGDDVRPETAGWVGGWRLEFGESAKRKKEIALACEDS